MAKSKLAGFLRGLLGRAENRAPARGVSPGGPPPPSAQKSSLPPAAPRVGSARLTDNSDQLELPLTSVVAGLPMDLRAKLMAAPAAGATICLQAEAIISQLAFGAVKISFGELRHLAPGVFVNSGGELDNKLVNLPLQEILPRLNPAMLARRTAKKVEVADEIVGPFSGRGKGFSFTTEPLKTPGAPAPRPAPEPVPSIALSPLVNRQISPPSMTPPVPPRGITPATPSIPAAPLNPHPLPKAGNGHGTNGTNGHGRGNGSPATGTGLSLPPGLRLGSITGNPRAEAQPPLKMAPRPPEAPIANAPRPSPAPRPVQAPLQILTTLGDLCESWPEDLKQEIISSPLAHASVALEGAAILPGLKRGRVVLSWKQLRSLAQPSSAPSPKDNLELELPLKVITPLFLASQKNLMRPRAKASVSAEIPDLFFGFPSAEPATAASHVSASLPPLPPAVPAAAPAATSASVPPQRPPAAKPADTNFYVWGEAGEAPQSVDTALRRNSVPQTDFMSRQAHPKDVVARAIALPGVVGAVVAMQDGLRVASQIPAEFNAETLAAFLPQIYERVNQSTRELRMGPLNNVSFTVGNVPWKIFRVSAVYFAAFGRAGEQLPSGELAQLAGELDRKKQQ